MCVCVVCVVSVCVWVCVCPGISSIIAIIPVFIFLWFFFVLLYFSFVQHFLSLTIVFVIFYNTHFCVTFSISLFLVILSILWYFDILWFCLTFFPGPQFPSVLSVVWSGVNSGASWWGVNREWTAAQINYTTKEFGRNHISADENDGFFSYILLWKVSRVQLACCIYTITIHCIQVYNLNIWVQVCTDKLHTWTEHLISVIFRKTGKENGSSGNTEHVLTENGNKNKIK